MTRQRIGAFFIIVAGIAAGWLLYSTRSTVPLKRGLELSGGTHLVYKADTSNIAPAEVAA